jgi:lysophospholipid acyltransferase (LPLAT)-like uncharacterized protein
MKKINFKALYKKHIKSNEKLFYVLVFIVSIIAYIYLRFVMLTSIIRYDIKVDKKLLKNNTYILAFWHGRLLSAFFIRKFFSRSVVLISYNRSAYIVKLIANYFRTSVIRGSKNKGGQESIKDVLKELRKPKTVFAIAPDGSVGPLMRCNPGIATISLLAKVDILPITFSAKRGLILKSWDRFFIPLPFNSIKLHLQEPMSRLNSHGEKREIEDIRIELENKLNNMTWQLDDAYGRAKIMPADVDKRGKPLKLKVKNNNG